MTPDQYAELWQATDKWIGEEIRFTKSQTGLNAYEFENVSVESNSQWTVLLNGRYDCEDGSTTFNFVVKGVGPFSRYDVNGAEHRDAGRTHQHIVEKTTDVNQNLPTALPRPDLAMLSPMQIWHTVCAEGHISHYEQFWEPENLC